MPCINQVTEGRGKDLGGSTALGDSKINLILIIPPTYLICDLSVEDGSQYKGGRQHLIGSVLNNNQVLPVL